jgi:hypothetical protein
VVVALLIAWTGRASAEPIVALASDNALIMFDSATPHLAAQKPITGVMAGDTLVGVDRRPSTGPLNSAIYALGVNFMTGTGRIYTLNPLTGAATLRATLAADPADATSPFPFTIVSGTTFGVDFNPLADRLRVTSNTGQNLRINVDSGLVQLDVPLAYQAGDPNFGDVPVDVAVAYSNNFAGAMTTVLRGVDVGNDPDVLVVHSNPNGGLLMTSLSLPFNSDPAFTAYDVSGRTGTSYFVATPMGSSTSALYAGTTLIGTIVGGATIRGMAASVAAPVVTGIAPASGPVTGGTVVTLAGSGFSAAPGEMLVMFGGTPAADVTCASSTSCTATSPSGVGTVSVLVAVSGVQSTDTPADDFTYVGPPPVVAQIAPTSGPVAGGTVVTISGSGFSTGPGGTTVAFGAVAATNVTCAATTTCQATSPAGVAGAVDVRVTVAGQTSANTPADDFTYTAPPAPLTYFLAEGATGTFFDDDVLIANPNVVAAPVTLTFFKEDGTTVVLNRTLDPQSRVTIHVDDLDGLEDAAPSAQVVSETGAPLVVERTMFWDEDTYGGHTVAAVPALAQQWLFGEGSQGFFDTFILVTNPGAATNVTFTFFLESGAAVVRTYPVAASSRFTLHAGTIPELIDTSFGVRVEAPQPIVAERAMYFGTTPTRLWSGGHGAAGSSVASQNWFHAEGATGAFFTTYILVSNPQLNPANVTLTFLLDNGDTVTVPKVVPAERRMTVNIAAEDSRLAHGSISTLVTSDVPVVSERSMYWPGEASSWSEAHNSPGATATGTRWGLAEGRVGGALDMQTYILLANPQNVAAEVTVTYVRESAAPVTKLYTVSPTSRFNIDVNASVPELQDESFGAVVTVTNGVEIVVERSMYWNTDAVFWAGGSNALGTRLP